MCSVRSVVESVLKVFEAVCDECDDYTESAGCVWYVVKELKIVW